MKKIKIKISRFNQYVILSIVLLFTYLFYLSIPALYDYERLQKDLGKNLSKELKLNINLSKNIKYRILPKPHFEIIESKLNSFGKPVEILGTIKNLKIYVSILNLINQDKILINSVTIEDSIFDVSKKNFIPMSNYFSKKINSKKLTIKKSKIFYKDKDKVVTILNLNNFSTIFNEKNDSNFVKAKGNIFNTPFNITWKKNFQIKNQSDSILNLPAINLEIDSILIEDLKNKENNFKTSAHFAGSKLDTKINIKKDEITFSSIDGSNIFKNKLEYSGQINVNPFYFDTNIEISEFNLSYLKIIDNYVDSLEPYSFLFNRNLNGKIAFKANKVKNKLFDEANFIIEFKNGAIELQDTKLISKHFGDLKIQKGRLFQDRGSTYLKFDILININSQDKFYKKFQVPIKYRKKLSTIRIAVEKNISENSFEVTKFEVNSKKNDQKDLINSIISNYDLGKSDKITNWIELKKLFNEIIRIV